ncbi:MAG: YHYH protein [Bacteroidetes bacterium]|nr:MAG: YHYH protein [Bacteroidota bacterium]
MARADLEAEAQAIRNGCSCRDGIQNGEEAGIDACDNDCNDTDELSTENIGCCATPDEPSVYYEYLENDQRHIYTNNFPNHAYCYNPNQLPEQTYYHFRVEREPIVTNDLTPVVRPNGRPRGYFGVSTNGVIFAPAPAQPFIFENPNTGQFNWDWVFEPTNNQGDGRDLVALDCASAHTGPQGYHYHGNMFEYVEQLVPGISTTTTVPEKPLHIGWAADGHPILYRFGPDADGNLKELQPSYQLQSGLRPGDGITAPCDPYTGKYTRDYAYLCGKGDLDECNGIMSSVTVTTAEGPQTSEYYYVITSSFPQIPRCLVGNVSTDFDNSSPPLTGIDADNDGFIVAFDCDDTDPAINPLALEITGNDIDENCDGVLTPTTQVAIPGLVVGPNPSDGNFQVKYEVGGLLTGRIFSIDGQLVDRQSGRGHLQFSGLRSGSYLLQIQLANGKQIAQQIIVQ